MGCNGEHRPSGPPDRTLVRSGVGGLGREASHDHVTLVERREQDAPEVDRLYAGGLLVLADAIAAERVRDEEHLGPEAEGAHGRHARHRIVARNARAGSRDGYSRGETVYCEAASRPP